MNQQIGVLLNSDNKLSDIFELKTIEIYEKDNGWKVVKTIDDITIGTENTAGLRKGIAELAEKLGECKVLAGSQIIGMPYHLLDREGFILCEAEELSDVLLDALFEDYLVPKEEKAPEEYVPSNPQPVDNEGNFYLDFIKVQKARPNITSKKALLPFLSHELFQTVTVICDHMMPWLERFVEDRGLEMSSKREDGKYVVVISHKYCENS